MKSTKDRLIDDLNEDIADLNGLILQNKQMLARIKNDEELADYHWNNCDNCYGVYDNNGRHRRSAYSLIEMPFEIDI